MTTTATPYRDTVAPESRRHTTLRRLIAGAAPFDGVMGVACFAAAREIGDALSVGTGTVRATGVIFLAAAVAGAATLRRSPLDVRWVVAANGAFAAWCAAALGFAGPGVLGGVLLAGAAATSAGTAIVEHRLAR